MAVEILSELTYGHFEQMYRLEARYYGEESITPADRSFAWYERYPRSIVAAADNGRIVGFVNLFPVKEAVFCALLGGEFNDRLMTAEDIADADDPSVEKLDMFLCCVVVDGAYRARGLTKRLLREAASGYACVQGRCAAVIADTVTPEGAALCERYGFSFIRDSSHGSRIYMQPFARFFEAVGQEEKCG